MQLLVAEERSEHSEQLILGSHPVLGHSNKPLLVFGVNVSAGEELKAKKLQG